MNVGTTKDVNIKYVQDVSITAEPTADKFKIICAKVGGGDCNTKVGSTITPPTLTLEVVAGAPNVKLTIGGLA
jgi:hypothetical protein